MPLFLIGIDVYFLVHFIVHGMREVFRYQRDHNNTALEHTVFGNHAQAQLRKELAKCPNDEFLHSALIRLGDFGLKRPTNEMSINELISDTFFAENNKLAGRDTIARYCVLFLEGLLPVLLAITAILALLSQLAGTTNG
jgi:hypothetical protein